MNKKVWLGLVLVFALLVLVVNLAVADQPAGPDWQVLCENYVLMRGYEQGVNGTLSDDIGRLIADAEARGWFNCDDYQ